ncbi:MAG: amino acid adenylation domain-containing protein [Gammaproteobacteria bacterium]
MVDIYPVTPMQHGMLFHTIYEAGRDAYLSQLVWKLEGSMNLDAFRAAWQMMADRHVALRTGIATEGLTDPVQVAYEHISLPVNHKDWSDCDSAEFEKRYQAFLAEDRAQEFDLQNPPLLRLNLFRVSDSEHRFVWSYHHIVLDGWSLPVVIGELMNAYHVLAEGRKPDLGEVRSYRDYVEWLCRQDYRDAEKFWRDNLAGLEAPTELPAARMAYNPALGQGEYGAKTFALSEEITTRLRSFAQQHRLTLSTVVQGVWSILLSRYSSDDQIIFGATTSGRPAELENVDSMVGLLINALPITTTVNRDETSIDWLHTLQERQLSARQYEYASLVEVQGWSDVPRGVPLFNTLLVLENYPSSSLWSGTRESLAITGMEPIEWTNYPLTAVMSVSNQFYLRLDYDHQYYGVETVEQIAGHFLTLLQGIMDQPELRIGALPMLNEPEKDRLLYAWNETDFDYPHSNTMHGKFEGHAAQHSDAAAVWFNGEEITYGELNRRANVLAKKLQSLGAKRGDLIGISVERCTDMITGLLAILKAGCAYVPLDPNYPPDRVAFMLEDSSARILLTQEKLVAALPEHDAELICLDVFDWGGAGEGLQNPDSGVQPDGLGYVIYTSGSTGIPKGVAIEHRNAVALIEWAGDVFEPEQFAGVLASTSVCFDLSVYEIFCTLGLGGRIVLVQDALALPDLPASANVTLINTVPSAIAELVRVNGVPESVETVNLAGEPLTTALSDSIYALGTVKDVNDLYGPSEDTTYSTWTRREPGGTPTIGRPVHNTRVYLLDPEGEPVPVGVPGEMYLGGAGVTRGYLNRPELTAEKYIPDPYNDDPDARLYRTGDRARYRMDTNIEFLGRLDHQIKLRGFRIELGEIETRIEEHDAVENALVIVREDNPGDQRLVAYLMAGTDKLDREQVEQWESEQVAQWEDLWQNTYSEEKDVELGSDFSGWISSYTGEPIPLDEMRRWIDSTTDRINSLQARRVLEIGSGTGLVAARVAPHCEHYLATDFSAAVVETLTKLKESDSGLASMEPRQSRADELSAIEPKSYDAVIINSVAQYFPDADYFVDVVRKAIAMLADGGHLFLGDLRDLMLLDAYHSSVQLFKANDSLTVANLASRIRQRIDEEEELLIDPAVFAALTAEIPRISQVHFQLKRGNALNELTRFRYDVIIEVGDRKESSRSPDYIDWKKAGLSLRKLEGLLNKDHANGLLIRGIPNARLVQDAWAMERFSDAGDQTVSALRTDIENRNFAAVEPEEIYSLMADFQWDLQLLAGENGTFDVLCQPANAQTKLNGLHLLTERGEHWADYTNDPLRGKLARSLEPLLRAKIKADLPEYMMPAAFIIMDEFPLTPNGKIDRKKLPAPEWRPQKDYVAPRTPVEETLAEIWATVLRLDRVGIYDDFFALGGHSLLAMQLISRIRDQLDAPLAMINLFNHPTIAGLGELLDGAESGEVEIPRVDRTVNIPLSFAQERLWFLDKMLPGEPTYNMPLAFRLSGELDSKSMQTAVDQLVNRHESLRTTFAGTEEDAVQLIAAEQSVVVEHSVLQDGEELGARITELAHEPFDLTNGPLFRVCVIKVDDQSNVLALLMHHIISDAWSQELIYRELVEFYEGHLSGTPVTKEALSVQYADYAGWQRKLLSGEGLGAALSYWKQKLGDAPPLMNLPLDKQRPAVETHVGAHTAGMLSTELSDALTELARERGCTMFVLFLTAFEVLLQRYSGEKDLVIGTPISGRQRTDLEGIVGFFLNTLAVRCDLSGDPTFNDLVARTRQTTLEAFEHQDLPFEKLVEELQPTRALSHAPIFQVLFVLHQMSKNVSSFSSINVEGVEFDYNVAKFDLQLTITETYEGFALGFQHNVDLFEAETIQRMLEHFRLLLEGIVADPDARIGDYNLLHDQEQALLLQDLNANEATYPPLTPVEMFEHQAEASPDAVAVEFGEQVLTYAELNEQANFLARQLQEQGIGPGSMLAICLERSLYMPLAVLATLKTGAAYVPVDPEYPSDRISYMLDDCCAQQILTSSDLVTRLASPDAGIVLLDELEFGVGSNLVVERKARDPLYAIYTSGSTGLPKGVILPLDGLVNLIHWQQQQPGLDKPARTLQFASLSFDVSFQEMFSTWAQGGTLVMIEENMRRELPMLAGWIAEQGIERLYLPYAALQPLAEAWQNNTAELALNDVIVAGEQLQITPAGKQLFTRLKDARLHNQYGPSETHVVTAHTLTGEADEWPALPPIGVPVANTSAYVLDEHMKPQPIGVPGELYIGGVQVALGYLNRPDLTNKKFISSPFVQGELLYKTGDRVRVGADGTIDYLGRTDDQVKWRGFRVEPGEIEALLSEHADVSQAAVLLREDEPGDKRLVAYLLPEEGAVLEQADLRSFARERLPDYMVPANFMLLDEMPLTPSGKVNRRALPEPELTRSADEATDTPESESARNIARIWQQLLKVDEVYLDDNFFDIGGHSLLTIKFVNKVLDATGEQLSIADVFENPTLRELSPLLDDADWDMAAIGLSDAGLFARVRKAFAGLLGRNR